MHSTSPAGMPARIPGRKVLIFHNYIAEVMEQHRIFSNVMQSLRELKVGHVLHFPAKLCITHNGNTKVFSFPLEAKLYVNEELRQLDGTNQELILIHEIMETCI